MCSNKSQRTLEERRYCTVINKNYSSAVSRILLGDPPPSTIFDKIIFLISEAYFRFGKVKQRLEMAGKVKIGPRSGQK